MAGPNAKMKVSKKNGITFESNVEHVLFTIEELIQSANKDVGRFLRKEVANSLFESYKDEYVKGKKHSKRREKLLKKHVNKTVQYWARKKENDLIIGYKYHNWMTQQELGEYNYPKIGVLRNTVYANLGNIKTIQARYITALNEDNPNTDNGIPEIGDGDNV